MQPIKYLNGFSSLGNPTEDQLARYDYLVIEEANGKRRTIANPALQGLGFLPAIIGAGAKIIGGLIGKNSKNKAAASAATASPDEPAAASQPGFFNKLANNFQLKEGGMLDNLKSQVSSLQNASNLKEMAFGSFIDKQKEELSRQNQMLTQSNAEVQRMLDKTDSLQKMTDEKIAELRELVKAQETKAQLQAQEEKLKEEIRRMQAPDQTGKILTYVGVGAAIFLAARSFKGPSLNGVDTVPGGRKARGRKSSSKVKTVTI
jgi:hypothetical protein